MMCDDSVPLLEKTSHSLFIFFSIVAPYYDMILFGFACYLHLGAINRCSLHIFQYLSTSDTQRIVTFHFSSASLFLKSNSLSASSRCFVPSSFCGHRQRYTGWGRLLSAALMVRVTLRPGPDPTAVCIPHPPPSSAMCHAGGAPLCRPCSRVALFPIYPLSEESIKVCSHFLTEAEGEFWEQDVETQRCISERGRKKELLAVILTLLVFPFFKPR